MLLDSQVINLNTGSFGPLPKPVFDRVTQLRRRLAEEPMDFLLREGSHLLWTARERLAQFLNSGIPEPPHPSRRDQQGVATPAQIPEGP